MELINALSVVEEALVCVYLRWATEDVVYMTLNIEESLGKGKVKTGECFRLVSLSSIAVTAQFFGRI